MDYLGEYLGRIRESGNIELHDSIKKTASEIEKQYIQSFNYMEHAIGLLVGNVQSGKTAQMFGVICAAANNDFQIFLLLTTNSIMLQQQTFKRVKQDLSEFCVCDESDFLMFRNNFGNKPVVIVLKKDPNILRTWRKNFSSVSFITGNPLFIVDDEADAASLNTRVNQNKVSTINSILKDIKSTSTSSIYLEVTGTPQANLLQAAQDGWKPYFIYYFKPGKNYLGGDFFFSRTEEENPYVILTGEDEADLVVDEDEFPENGLKDAIIIHLITSAELFLRGKKVSNCLIHPSAKIKDHKNFASKIGEYLNDIVTSLEEREYSRFDFLYDNLKNTAPDMLPKSKIYAEIQKLLSEERRAIIIINSNSNLEESKKFLVGMNFIVGGNSLGRGLTFPQLQTVYYCRVSKNPQADTMWQHARMFGYDRVPQLMRVFMPPHLFQLFCEINEGNNNIINQIKNGINNIKIYYPKGLNPTRKNVVNKRKLSTFMGGVNYFPFSPENKSVQELDEILQKFSDNIQYYSVNLNIIINILNQIKSDNNDWNVELFKKFILSEISNQQNKQGILLVRRNRNIGRGTGTLLSPTDRKIGDSIHDKIVLTMYKVTGEKGWNGKKIWIPNIKFPNDMVYYDVE